MAYTMGCLSVLQTADALYHATTATILWDATTLKAEHLNDVTLSLYEESQKVRQSFNL